jgi:hypothetical protein
VAVASKAKVPKIVVASDARGQAVLVADLVASRSHLRI